MGQKIIVITLFVFLLTSCASRKEVVYFQDTGNFETLVSTNRSVSKFKVDDLVSIHVSSLNPEEIKNRGTFPRRFANFA